jgi:Methyltransferase domain
MKGAAAMNHVAPASTPDVIAVTNGIAEVFERYQIVGWVEAEKGAPPVHVGLYVNEIMAVETWAVDGAQRLGIGDVRTFRLQLDDFWRFVKVSDRISVRVGGRAIPIAGKGMYLRPGNDGPDSTQHLQALLADGYVFGPSGKLQLSKAVDRAWQATVMRLYQRLRATLAETVDYDLFLVYGTLLGVVRESAFIGHDLDFDCAYISSHPVGEAAARELQQIAFVLIDTGFQVHWTRKALHISDAESGGVGIELFHLYFDEAGRLQFPFGVAGRSDFIRSQWRGVREIPFAGSSALIPKGAEAIAEHIYGPSWRNPNPGFDWSRDRAQYAAEGIPTDHLIEEVYWADFYARTSYDTGSSFFDLVSSRTDLPDMVVDIGCGDGRDSYAFARAGRQVVGLDRSHVAIAHATKKAQEMGLRSPVAFTACDVSDAKTLRATLTAARGEDPGRPVLFYARFFLHSIPEDTQRVMMTVIQQCSRHGDCFAAEFRTDKDEATAKVHGEHYRRFQNGPAFGRQLSREYGFITKLVEQEGNGFSPYKGEDPHLYRIIARRDDHEMGT